MANTGFKKVKLPGDCDKIQKIEEDLKLISDAAYYGYYKSNRRYPSSLQELVPQYISAVPINPVDSKPYEYEARDNNQNYRLCSGYIRNIGKVTCYIAEVSDYGLAPDYWEKRKVEMVDRKNIRTAIKAYYNQNHLYPAALNDLTPNYLNSIPLNPWGENYEYKQINGGENYRLYDDSGSYLQFYYDSLTPLAN